MWERRLERCKESEGFAVRKMTYPLFYQVLCNHYFRVWDNRITLADESVELVVGLKEIFLSLYANSTTQRCPEEIMKNFLIEDFFHLLWYQRHRW